ncbi:hypothetical protein M011DRAFT_20520 [Sporormia fimetaria CBS 119925]|uniref:Uncharacterized protein n=1 Tax=Sporormia fimetaria CBS 119925 TaxID=1340428 RepID=A0A6A6VQ10_9PLEO|nr:hypothetical protein M011DRAFT_20520 [Sporormia fimetaria CBS 119925]
MRFDNAVIGKKRSITRQEIVLFNIAVLVSRTGSKIFQNRLQAPTSMALDLSGGRHGGEPVLRVQVDSIVDDEGVHDVLVQVGVHLVLPVSTGLNGLVQMVQGRGGKGCLLTGLISLTGFLGHGDVRHSNRKGWLIRHRDALRPLQSDIGEVLGDFAAICRLRGHYRNVQNDGGALQWTERET